jgi:hypothetical protein
MRSYSTLRISRRLRLNGNNLEGPERRFDLKDRAIDEARAAVARISQTATVLTYSDYVETKSSLLSRPHAIRFPHDLAWLYDPDSWRQDVLPMADWENKYKFVVILNDSAADKMSEEAKSLISLVPDVGLVIFFPS